MKISNNSRLIPTSDSSSWIKALNQCGNYDIYHLPQYHLLAEKMGQGTAYLFFFHYNKDYAALPFLLRPISDVKGLESCAYNDITSVYGYPGVITSKSEDDLDTYEFRDKFQKELVKVFEHLSVVSFFSRTNPLLETNWLFSGFTEVVPLATTIAIELSKSDEEQLKGITKGHKYDIRKANNNGVIVEEDKSFQYIDDFISIYNATMKRNSAAANYYFPKDYYLSLKQSLGDSMKLYLAKFDGVIISSAMFFFQKNIIQYHLSGSLSDFFHLNGAKLIIDEVRKYGTKNDFIWLHLGGGVGSSEDSLFRFKAGFSKARFPFQIIKKIVNKDIYSELCIKRKEYAKNNNLTLQETNYFPDYRKTTVNYELQLIN